MAGAARKRAFPAAGGPIRRGGRRIRALRAAALAAGGYARRTYGRRRPTFGAPCPTTIFTFGLLLWAEERVPRRLRVIPFVWALAGISAVWVYGIVEDVGLPIAAVVGLVMLLSKDVAARRATRRPAPPHTASMSTARSVRP